MPNVTQCILKKKVLEDLGGSFADRTQVNLIQVRIIIFLSFTLRPNTGRSKSFHSIFRRMSQSTKAPKPNDKKKTWVCTKWHDIIEKMLIRTQFLFNCFVSYVLAISSVVRMCPSQMYPSLCALFHRNSSHNLARGFVIFTLIFGGWLFLRFIAIGLFWLVYSFITWKYQKCRHYLKLWWYYMMLIPLECIRNIINRMISHPSVDWFSEFSPEIENLCLHDDQNRFTLNRKSECLRSKRNMKPIYMLI